MLRAEDVDKRTGENEGKLLSKCYQRISTETNFDSSTKTVTEMDTSFRYVQAVCF